MDEVHWSQIQTLFCWIDDRKSHLDRRQKGSLSKNEEALSQERGMVRCAGLYQIGLSAPEQLLKICCNAGVTFYSTPEGFLILQPDGLKLHLTVHRIRYLGV